MEKIIEVNNISKVYTIKSGNIFSKRKAIKKKAVDNVSFSVNKGEKVAFIGSNGAGKSTVIKMLTGILQPTSGSILVGRNVPFKNRVKNNKKIGVVFGQKSQLWWDIPVKDTLKILKDIYAVSDVDYNYNIILFNKVLGLKEFVDQPVRKLSLGQRVRAEIAAALIHNPEVLYLDEPTIGLDIAVKKKLHEFLNRINREKNITIFLTSHDMSDIERVCERVIIIDHGKIIYNGQVTDLLTEHRNWGQINVSFETEIETSIFNNVKGIKIKRNDDNKLSIFFDKGEISVAAILNILIQLGEVSKIGIKESSLEEVLMDMLGE